MDHRDGSTSAWALILALTSDPCLESLELASEGKNLKIWVWVVRFESQERGEVG